MGVHGLWEILEPVARPMRLEAMARKSLAIDASIWIYQFLKAVRDKEGNALRNSHIVGFFRRICKLLFFGIRPVFVFDGGAPLLKKKTIASRKLRRQDRRQDATRTAERLMTLQIQRHALEGQQQRHDSTDHNESENNPSGEELPESSTIRSVSSTPFRKTDPYHLPALDTSISDIAKATLNSNDPRMISDQELAEYATKIKNDIDIGKFDATRINFSSETFRTLPIETQYQLLSKARLKSRLRMGYTKEQLDEIFPDRMDFSRFQIQKVAQRHDLTDRLMNFNGMGTGASMRIAGERGGEYVLEKSDNGYTLSLAGGKQQGTIDLDEEEQVGITKTKDKQEDDDDGDWVDVPIDDKGQEEKDPAKLHIGEDEIWNYLPQSLMSASAALNRQDLYDSRKQEDQDLFLNEDVSRTREQQLSDEEEDQDMQKAISMSLQDSKKNKVTANDDAFVLQTDQNNNENAQINSSSSSVPFVLEGGEVDLPVSNSAINSPKPVFNPAERIDFSSSLFTRAKGKAAKSKKTAKVTEKVTSGKESDKSIPFPPWFSHDASKVPDMGEITSAPSDTGKPGNFNLSTPEDDEFVVSLNEPSSEPITSLKSDKQPISQDVQTHTNLKSVALADADTSSEANVQLEPDSKAKQEKSIPSEDATDEATILPDKEEEDADDGFVDVILAQEEKKAGIPDQVPITIGENDDMDVNIQSEKVQGGGDIEWEESDYEDDRPYKLREQQQQQQVSSAKSDSKSDDAKIDENNNYELFDLSEEEEDDGNAGLQEMLEKEGEEHARFASSLNAARQDHPQGVTPEGRDFAAELVQIRQQQRKDRRDADEVTQIMIRECQELLRYFGIPYIVSPMEAEAQCAELVRLGLVDGIVTDDSDTFLFGGTKVFKNMFNQAKYVECYLTPDIEREIGLDQDKLIGLAYLLGSDYTEGLPKIGPVSAMELLAEFSAGISKRDDPKESVALEALQRFRDWWKLVQLNDPKADLTTEFKRRFKKSHATSLFLEPGFPDEEVYKAYVSPEVNQDRTRFQWGVPDLDGLRSFLMSTVGWSKERTDEILLPVIRDMNRRLAEGTQANLTDFFYGSIAGVGGNSKAQQQEPTTFTTGGPRRAKNIAGKSKRMLRAIDTMAHGTAVRRGQKVKKDKNKVAVASGDGGDKENPVTLSESGDDESSDHSNNKKKPTASKRKQKRDGSSDQAAKRTRKSTRASSSSSRSKS